MPLTAQEAFKVGFLSRCVEAQLSPEQTYQAVKTATDLFIKGASITGLLGTALDKTLDVGKGVAGHALSYGIPAALAAPPILGGVAGYGLARATDVDDTDVAEIKNRELIQELRRQADKLRRQKTTRDFSARNQPHGRPLLM